MFAGSFNGTNWRFRKWTGATDITISKCSISLAINYVKCWFYWNALQVPRSELLHMSLMATSNPIRYHGTDLVTTSPLNNIIMQDGANVNWEYRNKLNSTIFKVVDCLNYTDVLSGNNDCKGRTFCTVCNCQVFYPQGSTETPTVELIINTKKTKLRGLSSRANYTDRAAAAGRRS
jgi:hypothetical protein